MDKYRIHREASQSEPPSYTYLFWIEIRRPRHLLVLEQVLVALCGHRLREVDRVNVITTIWRPLHHDIGVRRNRRGDEEERLSRIDRLV